MPYKTYSPRRRKGGSERAAREYIEDQGEVWDGEDFVETQGLAEQASFPALIMVMAIAKDMLDLPLELTFVGIMVTTMTSLMISLVLFLWFMSKMGGVWYKRKLIKWLWKRLFLALTIEMIPFLKIVPATTILVYMAYNHENKLVRMFNRSLELMHGKAVSRMTDS